MKRYLLIALLATSCCDAAPRDVAKVVADESFCVDICIRRMIDGKANTFPEVKAYCEDRATKLKCCYKYSFHFCGEDPFYDDGAK
jgi:hypothetical protein